MKKLLAIMLGAASIPALAGSLSENAASTVAPQPGMYATPKAVSTQTLGSRATVTSTDTAFGGFEIRSSATVYVLVRGNSLGTLGVTQDYLDLPRARLYNGSGQDIITDGLGRAGFNSCLAAVPLQQPVVNYYANVRHQAVADGDACVAVNLTAGVYTFSVTPSIPGKTSGLTSVPDFGQMLFEVTLAP